MCDHAAYEALKEQIEELKGQLADHEKRLVGIETSQGELKSMVKEGFAETRAQFHDIYDERVAWGQWARHALTEIGKWLGKWSPVIICVAIGVGNAKNIVEIITNICK